MKKRIVSVLLTLVMTVGILMAVPMSVGAESKADALVRIAKAEVGTQEDGKDNVKYNNYNGQQWCAWFVTWCAQKAGLSDIIPKFTYTPDGYNNVLPKAGGKQHSRNSGYKPKKGDIIFFNMNGERINHVGIVYYSDNTYVYYYDGNNTSTTPHCVADSKKKLTDNRIVGYITPNYGDALGAVSEININALYHNPHKKKITSNELYVRNGDTVTFGWGPLEGAESTTTYKYWVAKIKGSPSDNPNETDVEVDSNTVSGAVQIKLDKGAGWYKFAVQGIKGNRASERSTWVYLYVNEAEKSVVPNTGKNTNTNKADTSVENKATDLKVRAIRTTSGKRRFKVGESTSLKATIKGDNLYSVKVEIYKGTNNYGEIINHRMEGNGVVIDNLLFKEAVKHKVVITATDKAGNKKTRIKMLNVR